MRTRRTTKSYQYLYAGLLVVMALVISFSESPAYAWITNDLNAYQTKHPWYNPKDTCGGSGGASSIPAGTLPKIIPEPYNGAFTAAGKKHNVAPALIAALFTEENFTATSPTEAAIDARWKHLLQIHPDPNSGWPTNQFHTLGAFQFIPGTWAAYGDDGNGDGVKDPQNIADGAAGAANYVAHNGATADKPPASWQNAIFAYNHAQWYVDAVMAYYDFYNRGGTGGTAGDSSTPLTPEPSSPCAGSSTGNTDCNSGTGNILILCQAKKFDPFGYLWGGGHGDPAQFMNNFNAAGGFTGPFRQWVDCSGLETVAIYLAFKYTLVFSTDTMASHTEALRQIPVDQAQPGDLMWHPGHTEIASNKGGTTTFGAHTDGIAPEKQISGDAGPQHWDAAFVYIGPGSDRK